MKQIVLFLVVIFTFCSCASEECSDGKCNQEEYVDVNWGNSRVLALNPEDGELLWGLDFQGEKAHIKTVQNDGKNVVFELNDTCWSDSRAFAFTVSDGKQTEIETSGQVELAYCHSILQTHENVDTFVYANGICFGVLNDNSGNVVAIDTADEKELWKKELSAVSIFADDDVLMALREVTVENTVQYRASRISTANGSSVWMYQQETPLIPIGANEKFVFFIDETVFALDKKTGDLAWEYELEGWQFNASQDRGELRGDVLYAIRQYFPKSPCQK